MTLSFLAFRWRFRGMEPDPGPFGPQHGITWTIARPARWHGHLQSLRNIIEGIPDQSYHLPQRRWTRSMSGYPGDLNGSTQHSSRTRLALKTKAKSLARVRFGGTLPWPGFD